MAPSEQFAIQGFAPSDIVPLASPLQMGRLAGNTMSLPVLRHIFDSWLPKLCPELSSDDE